MTTLMYKIRVTKRGPHHRTINIAMDTVSGITGGHVLTAALIQHTRVFSCPQDPVIKLEVLVHTGWYWYVMFDDEMLGENLARVVPQDVVLSQPQWHALYDKIFMSYEVRSRLFAPIDYPAGELTPLATGTPPPQPAAVDEIMKRANEHAAACMQTAAALDEQLRIASAAEQTLKDLRALLKKEKRLHQDRLCAEESKRVLVATYESNIASVSAGLASIANQLEETANAIATMLQD